MFQEATSLDDLYENEDAGSHHSVHWELEEVLAICKKLQKSTLVSSFDEILTRLLDLFGYKFIMLTPWQVYKEFFGIHVSNIICYIVCNSFLSAFLSIHFFLSLNILLHKLALI